MSATTPTRGLSREGTLAGCLQRAVRALLDEHRANGEIPTNGRFVFYELEQAGVVSKVQTNSRRPSQAVSEALMHLREQGYVPWAWIEDETRTLYEWNYAESVHLYVARSIASARINPWPDEPPLILCESRSLGGVLRNLAAEYLCPIAATNGQCGGFLRTEVAGALEGNERPVLYLGDFDLSGDQIEQNAQRVLEQATGREIDWQRIAITEAQTVGLGDPIEKVDRRYRPARSYQAWETEALGQGTVLRLVREQLDALLPEPLEDVQLREHEQREAVRSLLNGNEGPA